MSWMRLLKASPTFSGMSQLTSRYRMRQMNLIPRFGGKGAPSVGRVGAKTVPAAAPVAVAPVRPVEPRKGSWLGRVAAAVVRLCSLRPEPRGVRLAPMTGRKFVQPELRLDAVKPLRNDLSDCDFEVREVRPPAPAAGRSQSLVH